MAEAREAEALRSGGGCLRFGMESRPSQIKAGGGMQVAFVRAILTLRNGCDTEAADIELHAALGQEGGTVQDVTAVLTGQSASSLPAGGALSWDVYDLLLPAHQGTASKVHMFGYRAILNWRFTLSTWATYRTPRSPEPVNTSAAKWSLTWKVLDTATGAVGLSIEEIRE